MLRTTLRTAFAHKGRLALSAMAVILGVAFITGSLMLTNALDRTFVEIIEGSAQDVQVTGKPAVTVDIATDPGDGAPLLVSQTTVDRVRQIPGVAAAAGSVARTGVYLVDRKGDVVGAVGPPAIGFSWETNPALNISQITQGQAPTRPGEIVVDDVTFPKLDAAIGDQVRVIAPRGEVRAQLVGTFRYGETGGLAGATLTAFTPAQAQALLAEKDLWTAVDVAVAAGYTDEQVAAAIDSQLADQSLVVKTRSQQVEAQSTALREGLAFFGYILIGFAAIALMVSTFLIYNTFSMLVAQRGRELALLRAIGSTRWQILRSVLIEALLMAGFAVILGVGAGYLLAQGLSAAFTAMGLSLTAGISITAVSIGWAVVVGLAVTVLSVLVPAVRASRIPPLAALREATINSERIGLIRPIIGVVSLLAAVALIETVPSGTDTSKRTAQTAIGSVLLVVAVVVLSPLLVALVGRLVAPGLRLLGGATGNLAGRNVLRSPRRVATTASALTIGLALVMSVTVLTASAKASLEKLLDESFKADLIVSTMTRQPFDTGIAEKIRSVAGVEYVVSQSSGPAQVDGQRLSITAVGGGPLDSVYAVDTVAGEFGQLGKGQAVVSRDLANERQWKLGEQVEILFPSGKNRQFSLIGIYEPSSLLTGLVVPLEEYRTVGGAAQDRLLYVTTAPGADTNKVFDQVKTVAAANPLVEVLDQAGIKEQNSAQLNQLLYFIYAMLALSIIIAGLGVINTMALSVIERTHEIGLLRAVGATRRQVRRIIRWETVLVSLLGATFGISSGIIVGVALQSALADSGIDVLVIPWNPILVILVLALVIGLLAAVLPARQAAKTNLLRAVTVQ